MRTDSLSSRARSIRHRLRRHRQVMLGRMRRRRDQTGLLGILKSDTTVKMVRLAAYWIGRWRGPAAVTKLEIETASEYLHDAATEAERPTPSKPPKAFERPE